MPGERKCVFAANKMYTSFFYINFIINIAASFNTGSLSSRCLHKRTLPVTVVPL